MKKLKTKKAVLKRMKITGQKKMLRRKPGQDHFNAKESALKKNRKKEVVKLNDTKTKTFKKQLPYI